MPSPAGAAPELRAARKLSHREQVDQNSLWKFRTINDGKRASLREFLVGACFRNPWNRADLSGGNLPEQRLGPARSRNAIDYFAFSSLQSQSLKSVLLRPLLGSRWLATKLSSACLYFCRESEES
jgi:hypothetical protein